MLAGQTCVAGYVAVGDEADPAAALADLAAMGTALALPALHADAPVMTFRAWRPGDVLVRAARGFLQPDAGAPLVRPDAALIPLVAFDRQGNRLGQGGGDYDRALAGLPALLRIGLAWSVQEADALPAESWDMPMDLIVTECDVIRPPSSRIGFP